MDVELTTTPEWQAARERDSLRFLNDRDRCQDCGFVEACDCGLQWAHVERSAHN